MGSIAIYPRPRPWSRQSKQSWARAPGARKTAPQWAVLGDDRPPRSLLLGDKGVDRCLQRRNPVDEGDIGIVGHVLTRVDDEFAVERVDDA